MKIAAPMLTKPAAGVIATSPTTSPMAAPMAEGFLPMATSKRIKPIMAAADAMFVFISATVAMELAARAEPALNPNQPNQSILAPSKTKGILAG